jgi:perosamine synthetase
MSTGVSDETERGVAVYKSSVQRSFAFLKETTRLDDLFAKSVSLETGAGYLLPVCDLHTKDAALIANLARWRSENALAFPTQFQVTESGTARWLRTNVLGAPDRVLFIVVDSLGAAVGHLGLANAVNDEREVEVDNVVRGSRDAAPGIMTMALRALLRWTEEQVQPARIFLRVFDDNEHAIRFYRRLDFVAGEITPLRRHGGGGSVCFHPLADDDSEPPDKRFLRMDYEPTREVDPPELILTAGPSISARETSYALDAVRNGWNRRSSDYLTRFERAFADYVGVKHALATSSCTGALHLSLAALGIGQGDEVIVPDLTWVATANAVTYVGATPVFADVEPDSWCLDPDSMQRSITERTRAVIPVHLYGHPARMDRLAEIARAADIAIVEDAAPAIGAEWKGQRTGTFGAFAAFSFQGAKLLVTGEGGMIVTDDDDLYARVHGIWDQGRKPGTFWIERSGLKYKLANVQASIGLGQIERADELIEAKRRIFHWYAQRLEGVPGIALNHEVQGARSIYWMTSILLDETAGVGPVELAERLRERNIDTRSVFPAISRYPIWTGGPDPRPNAARIADRAINLPSGVLLRQEQVDYVCRSIRDIVGLPR